MKRLIKAPLIELRPAAGMFSPPMVGGTPQRRMSHAVTLHLARAETTLERGA
jgi:hypothetical protein